LVPTQEPDLAPIVRIRVMGEVALREGRAGTRRRGAAGLELELPQGELAAQAGEPFRLPGREVDPLARVVLSGW
jgi:hypothetical protein